MNFCSQQFIALLIITSLTAAANEPTTSDETANADVEKQQELSCELVVRNGKGKPPFKTESIKTSQPVFELYAWIDKKDLNLDGYICQAGFRPSDRYTNGLLRVELIDPNGLKTSSSTTHKSGVKSEDANMSIALGIAGCHCVLKYAAFDAQ